VPKSLDHGTSVSNIDTLGNLKISVDLFTSAIRNGDSKMKQSKYCMTSFFLVHLQSRQSIRHGQIKTAARRQPLSLQLKANQNL
jgi:hypothetical protein